MTARELIATSLRLPRPDGTLERYRLREPRRWPASMPAARTRVAFAAAHVVADPLADTTPLARHLFSAPTWYYKTGIAFLAWLAGHQPAFTLIGGLSSGRSLVHLAQTFRLADQVGLLPDPDLAAERMGHLLAVHGISA